MKESIINYFGEYYFLKQRHYSIDSIPFQLFSYSPIQIINSCKYPFEINSKKKKNNALPIRFENSNSEVTSYLNMEAPFLSPFFGNILIIFYFLVLFLLKMGANHLVLKKHSYCTVLDQMVSLFFLMLLMN